VKAVRGSEGGMDVLAYNLKTGEVESNMDYLDAFIESNLQTYEVGADVFEKHVSELRAKAGKYT